MKNAILNILCLVCSVSQALAQTEKPANIWIHYADKFCAADSLSLEGVDSVEFTKTALKRYKYNATNDRVTPLSKNYVTKEDVTYDFSFVRTLAKPSGYSSCDYTKTSSQWCFQRSMESDHFICFWEKGSTLSGSTVSFSTGGSVNVKTLLTNAEKIWKVYVEDLGFLVPGKSVTDKTKIHMYLKDQSDWRADGSGQNGTSWYYDGSTKRSKSTSVGLFHCNPAAATARGGHTPAHEIGHVFQYLVSADLGQSHGLNYGFGANASGGNEWWEDCANWQAYKVYPSRQFTDGEYLEQYMDKHHLNIHHEDARYTNCFYHDWWCEKHGLNTIGRVWRESNKPEDPTEAYMRIFGLNEETFADEHFEGLMRFTSYDIEAVRKYAGTSKIGIERQRLIGMTDEVAAFGGLDKSTWWAVDPDYCVQNYGYNANPMSVPAAGTVVKATFKGLAGAPGYRAINKGFAGWRYGIAAYCSDGTRVYSEIGRGSEGEVTFTVPEKCKNMWFVVMGAPTKYWRHPWDDNASNDEQWPYAVKFEGSNALGATRVYTDADFPEGYERKDTIVVINANLAYSSTDWSSVRVQLDTDAASQALGISTAALQAAVCGKKTTFPYVRIAGLNADLTTETNTKTIYDTDVIFGHWFNTSGRVQGSMTSTAAIFTKIYHDKYGCYVGQYPGRLTKGKTYIVREAIIYTDKDGKEYKAIMEIHLNVV